MAFAKAVTYHGALWPYLGQDNLKMVFNLKSKNPRRISFKKGAGALEIDISQINVKNMETKILELVNNKSFKEKAEELGQKIRSEDFRTKIHKTIIGE